MEQINKINVNGVDYQIKDETVPIADNEDISVVMNEETQKESYKLADRAYDEANFSGKGYKILRKNIVDGKNVLTQEMINEANTVYEIRYDFDLNASTINILENSIILFKCGSFKNGTLLFKNNSNIINITNQTIFYDIIFSSYSQLSLNCHFIDNWHNNPMLGTNRIIANVPHFYFTKNYLIEDDEHFQQFNNYNNIPHYLHGNGYTIRILSHNFTKKKYIFNK